MLHRSYIVAGMILISQVIAASAAAQFLQQGPKLVGTGATGGYPQQGYSVAVSADGNTAAVGGYYDNLGTGAVWVFTRNGGVWSQQGTKLVGAGAGAFASEGYSLALSGDGTMLVVGESGGQGACVFTRSGGAWSQQGVQLFGTGGVGTAQQGVSVAVSADGNTVLVGGQADNVGAGATWVFTRTAGMWSQQGSKLVGSGAEGPYQSQGNSVAVSGDGNTALIGGYGDGNSTGAAWVFNRIGGAWVQQGDKLVGSGATGAALQGYAVALSADGNTAVLGGFADNNYLGAAWVFTRTGAAWSQQGAKLVGAGAVGDQFQNANQGRSVAVSADGNLVVLGGEGDNFSVGAAWAFARSDGAWSSLGAKLTGAGQAGPYAYEGQSVAVSGDGNTVVVGGYGDAYFTGAAWVYVHECAPVHPNLIGWWRLDGDAADMTGSNPGILVGPHGSFVSAEVGQGFHSGDGSWIEVPSTPGFNLTHMTFDAWVNPDVGAPSATVIWKGESAYDFTTPFGLDIFAPDVLVHAGAADFLITDGVSAHDEVFSPGPIPQGVFTHLAATVDGDSVILYVNGARAAAVKQTATMFFNDSPLQFGGTSVGNPFHGTIDEFELHGSAATAQEIAALYAAGPLGKCLPVTGIGTRPTLRGLSLSASPIPSRGTVLIAFNIPRPAPVQLEIYDVAGRRLVSLLEGKVLVGTQTLAWNGAGHDGARMPGGVYFARLSAAGATRVARLIVVN